MTTGSAAAQIVAWIEADPWTMRALRAVANQRLADWWIVAGFVRAKVWDTLHGYSERTPLGDVDVVFFDPSLAAAEDRRIEARLAEEAPDYPWEVYNQAHLHEYNGDAPYRDTVDAFSRWAETVSTVGVSLDADGRVVVAAPHGVDDLVDMILRPNPHPDAHREVFDRRLVEKGWRDRWPKVRLAPGVEPA